ncbi:major head protein (Major coat protein) from bacteriophage origin [Escherichia coli]|uniref:Major head protein (Major coat protein) from bacteriophage origin n=1 Tax=Escherichia coli TaxID=562 RepID=A0A2X1JHH5_ECOLX|nr:major head protein (Major coat protein) from bacteriophage origin [Escherichia coli]
MEIIYVLYIQLAELLASTQHHFKFDPLFLRLFFRETYPFTTEKVYLSQNSGTGKHGAVRFADCFR